MARKRLNKKGSIIDIIYIIIAIVVISVGSLLVFKVSDEINQKFQDSDAIPAQGKTASTAMNNMYSGVLDNSFMLLVIGLSIAALALAAMVRIHPIFIVFFVILLVIIVFLAGVFSNIYQAVASEEGMDAADGSGTLLADRLVYMSYVMRFLPFMVGIIGLMMSFIMYKSWQNA